MSNSAIGRIISLEQRKKISLCNTGRKQTSETISKRVEKLKGQKRSLEARKKMSLAQVGNQKAKGHVRTEEHKRKLRESVLGIKRPQISGAKNPAWKGGTSRNANEIIRASLEYQIWRRAVFERDNYMCVWCKTTKSPFNADHIKPFALFPELRFAIDNGRTLCVPCHRTTDTWGGRIHKKVIPNHQRAIITNVR